MKASDIRSALARKYQPPEWCLYFEVADDTGTRQSRYADAVAMSIWPSRGYQIHGFEVKVSRSDFLSEMRDPEKADAVGQYCDFWWLATPPKLVHPDELPETWGLMECTKAGMRVKKQAPKTDVANMTRGFMAALLRRGVDMQQAHVRKAIEDGAAAREGRIAQEVERRTKRLNAEVEKQRKWIADFEAAFGRRPQTYETPENIAEAVKLAERLVGDYGDLERLRNHASVFIERVDAALPQIKARVE